MVSKTDRRLNLIVWVMATLFGITSLTGCNQEADQGVQKTEPTGSTAKKQTTGDEITSEDNGSLKRAASLVDEGKYREAIIEFKNAVQAAPENAAIRASLGDAYLKMGQPEAAEKELRRALELGAKPEEVTLSLIDALVLQRSFDDALTLLEDGTAVEGLPVDEVNVLRGEAYMAKGELAPAEIAFDSVLAAFPSSARALRGLAEVALRTKDFDRARGLINSAIEADQESAEAWSKLGRLDSEEGNLEKAEQAYTTALKYAVAGSLLQGELFWRRADVRVKLNNLEDAEKDLAAAKEATKGRGESAEIHFTQGVIHFRRGRSEPAEAAFNTVLKLRPDSLDAIFFSVAWLIPTESPNRPSTI